MNGENWWLDWPAARGLVGREMAWSLGTGPGETKAWERLALAVNDII